MSFMIAERPGNVDSERALATLWERAATLRDGLTTRDGRRYWVSYPGRPNARAGPDFLDARLLDEAGQTVSGDVELHLNAPDWYGHGHHSDPNYNGWQARPHRVNGMVAGVAGLASLIFGVGLMSDIVFKSAIIPF